MSMAIKTASGRGYNSIPWRWDLAQTPRRAGAQTSLQPPGETCCLKSFLADANYLDRFSFFSGHAPDSVVQLTPPLMDRVFLLLEGMLKDAAEKQPDLLRAELLQLRSVHGKAL